MKAYIMNQDIQSYQTGQIVAQTENWKHWLKKHCAIVDIPEELIGKNLKADLIDEEWVLSEVVAE